MPTSRFVRDRAFNLAREDLAFFLEEHEPDLLNIFREEMTLLDEELPEEEVYIDLDVAGIGDLLLRAVLRTVIRFLREPPTAPVVTTPLPSRRYRRDLRQPTPIRVLLTKLKRPKR